jgi:hypothetical protein
MKKTNLIFLITLFLGLSGTMVKAQTVTGTVKDELNEPVPFANVIVYSLPDSAFVAGSVTDINGIYSISMIDSLLGKSYLTISFIGYNPYKRNIDAWKQEDVILQENTTLLGEVVVTAHQKVYRMEGTSLIANIENSVLSNLGVANDVLSQLPFVVGDNGSFNVLGKGSPAIYINNRLVRDPNELSRLSSSDIKSVKVITSPGTQYNSTVNSVIQITTKKPVGDGFSGNLYGTTFQSDKPYYYGSAKLKYRVKGLEVFAGGDWKKSEKEVSREIESLLTKGNEWKDINTSGDYRWSSRSYNLNTGFNYDFTSENGIGLSYNFDKTPKNNYNYENNLSTKTWNNDDYTSLSNGGSDGNNLSHHLNAYYRGKLWDKLSVALDGDYLKGETYNHDFSQEDMTTGGDVEVSSESKSAHDLLATRLVFELPIWKGSMSFGGEYSSTNRTYDFRATTNINNSPFQTAKNKTQQYLSSGFVSYDASFGRFSATAGLRIENTGFSYYENNMKVEEQSKNYADMLPDLSLTYGGDFFKVALSYRSRVLRPSYSHLTSSMSYLSPSVYYSGNPFLMSNIRNSIDGMFLYRDIQLILSYERNKRNIYEINEFYEGSLTALTKPVNLPDYNSYTLAVAYSPTFGIWSPSLQGVAIKQDLVYGSPSVRYDKPLFQVSFQNRLKLPKDFLLLLDMEYTSQGHSATAYAEASGSIDLSISKSLMEKRMNIRIKASDILNTNRSKWVLDTNSIVFRSLQQGNTRGISLTISYNFNATRDKYKGKSAAEGEMERF